MKRSAIEKLQYPLKKPIARTSRDEVAIKKYHDSLVGSNMAMENHRFIDDVPS